MTSTVPLSIVIDGPTTDESVARITAAWLALIRAIAEGQGIDPDTLNLKVTTTTFKDHNGEIDAPPVVTEGSDG